MNNLRPNGWRIALRVAMLAVLLAACSGGGGAPNLPPLTLAGFLPIPTPTPGPTEDLRYAHERSDICAGFEREVCLLPGDEVNLYRAFSLADAIALRIFQTSPPVWVLDPAKARDALGLLDHDVTIAGRGPSLAQPVAFLTVFWTQGEGLSMRNGTRDSLDFMADANAQVMRYKLGDTEVEFPLPDGFLDRIRAAASPITPTPTPPPPPFPPNAFPTPTPSPTVLAPGDVFFKHPEGEVHWEGPDDRVWSRAEAHCGDSDLLRDFGIPAVIVVGDDVAFWAAAAVRREQGWRWTGYYYHGWEIWQGDDALVAYLVRGDEPRFAFEYRSYGCI